MAKMKTAQKILMLFMVLITLSSCSQSNLITLNETGAEILATPSIIPEFTIESTPTLEPTPTLDLISANSIPVFLSLTKEIGKEITDANEEASGYRITYEPIKNGRVWEIKYNDGKKITIEVTNKSDRLATVILDTTELAGKRSIFTVVTSKEAIVGILALGYYGKKRWAEEFLFSPYLDEFVVCPTYNYYNRSCLGTKFSTAGSMYPTLFISTYGVVVENATDEQFRNIERNIELESEPPTFDMRMTSNENRWCGLMGEEEIEYKLPGSEEIYKIGYGNCPVIKINPMIEVNETNMDDLGF